MNLIKKFLIILLAILPLMMLKVSAKRNAEPQIEPFGEFVVYEQDEKKVSEIIGMTEENLEEYCKQNNVEYLAVNKDNSKQIRLTVTQKDFSRNIVNLNNLSPEKIQSLIPEITGFSDVLGEVTEKNGQKFIKVNLKSSDSGGEYILTQYITVTNKKSYTLSFYTFAGVDTDYIEKTFESYADSEIFESEKNYIPIVITAFILFLCVGIFVAFTIIRDIKKERNENNELC